MWKAFLKKINTKKTIPFEQVIQKINKVLKPIYNSNLSQLT
jgi:antitoxin component of RelBE/YafQ-DinJ toxin-antitoxin module